MQTHTVMELVERPLIGNNPGEEKNFFSSDLGFLLSFELFSIKFKKLFLRWILVCASVRLSTNFPTKTLHPFLRQLFNLIFFSGRKLFKR